jgi:hypothetical protein
MDTDVMSSSYLVTSLGTNSTKSKNKINGMVVRNEKIRGENVNFPKATCKSKSDKLTAAERRKKVLHYLIKKTDRKKFKTSSFKYQNR